VLSSIIITRRMIRSRRMRRAEHVAGWGEEECM
jgi:hypothetical protein